LKISRAFGLPILCSLVLVGCGGPKVGGLLKHGSGLLVSTSAELMPDANPGAQKVLYGSIVIPVEVKIDKSAEDMTISLISREALLDTEKYRTAEKEFDVVNAAGEDYSPPIPLLKFPMNIGDSWSWKGQMVTAPTSRKATAVITTTDDQVDMGSPADALRVDVTLSMESGASAPAMRTLTFWFVKGKGIVKRDFGANTSRVPATAATP